jgi:hypothetical protein
MGFIRYLVILKMKFSSLRHVLSLISLALWRGRQHQFLPLMTSAGMVLIVTLVCMVPLLTTVMQTAALRNVLTAIPASSELAHICDGAIPFNAWHGQSICPFYCARFFEAIPRESQSRLEVQTPDFPIGLSAVPAYDDTPMRLDGDTLQEAASHITLLQGRLPQTAITNVEAALTLAIAALHEHVGSTFTLVYTFYMVLVSNFVPITNDQIFTQQIKLEVVGIFQVKPNDPFWHGDDFQPEFISRLWHYTE